MARSTGRIRLARTRFAAHAAMAKNAARLATLINIAVPLNLSSSDPTSSQGTRGNSTTATSTRQAGRRGARKASSPQGPAAAVSVSVSESSRHACRPVVRSARLSCFSLMCRDLPLAASVSVLLEHDRANGRAGKGPAVSGVGVVEVVVIVSEPPRRLRNLPLRGTSSLTAASCGQGPSPACSASRHCEPSGRAGPADPELRRCAGTLGCASRSTSSSSIASCGR